MVTLGQYDILTVVGETSTTNTHKARDKQTGEFVCIKLVSPEVENDQSICAILRERFLLEVQVSARLNHKNILHITSCFEDNGRPCLVTEFTDGDTVHRYLSQAMCFTVIDIVKIISHVLDAIEFVHQVNIIHRDIKPGNIFFTPGKKVKLGGFGLAKIDVDAGGSFANGLENMIVGTPNYMSPEQFPNHPEHKQLGVTTDLYSTAMVLFEMLTTAMNRELFDEANIMRAYMLRDTNSLSPVTLVNYIPLEFAKLISTALDPLVANRFQTAAQMRDMLFKANKVYQNNLLHKKSSLIESVPTINQTLEPSNQTAADGDASASDTGEGNLALFDRAILVMLTKEAIKYLGPATERLIKHVSKKVNNIDELIEGIALRILDTESRAKFIKASTPLAYAYDQEKSVVENNEIDPAQIPS